MSPRVAIFASFSGQGGVERMVAHLAWGMADLGVAVDLVLARAHPDHLAHLPPAVRVVPLGTRHTLTAIPALAAYLRRERPAALLAAKDRGIQAALAARALAGVPVPVVGRLGTTVSAALAGRSPVTRWWWYRGMARRYRRLHRLVAVSAGVAADVRAITGLSGDRLRVIPNPVITPHLEPLARETPDHPWFTDGGPPVVLGVGRLTRQKDFPTLLRAVASMAHQPPPRLVILGEGRDREALEALAAGLGIASRVALPGFTANPYACMARAGVFALSSIWEGSPNVLTEALALGVPAVATDCPSGPREVLDGGRVGPLVALGDVRALATAMDELLARPPDRQMLRTAVSAYHYLASARAYLDALGVSVEDRG